MSKEAGDIPHRVGRYDILLPLASGGMGKVYLARARGHGGFETEVALKITHSHLRESAEFSQHLIDEAKLAVRIRHRNVIATLDVGDDPLGLYLVMEYVEGDTLSGLKKRAKAAGEPLPIGVVVRLLLDALAGLHAAHELVDDETGQRLDVVHRDFTPSNILIGSDGVARLTDFGIAKAAARVGNTATGMMKGKVPYMAPEQARGDRVDRRTDVWAAGVVLWELFADRRMYVGLDEVATLLKIVTERPPRLSTLRPDIPAAIDEVVASALEPDAAKRCPSALELSRRLAAACRAAGLLAEPEEVEDRVRAILAPMVAERREQMAQVRRLRAEMGAITGRAEANAAAPPSSPGLPMPQMPMPSPSQPQTRTLQMQMQMPPMPAAEPTEPQTSVTDTTSSADRGVAPRARRPIWPIAAAAGGAAAIALAIVLVLTLTKPRPDAVTPRPEPVVAATTPVTAAPEPAPTPTPNVTAVVDAGAVAREPAPIARPAVVAATPTTPAPGGPAPARPKPTASSRVLAPSPYP